MAAPKIKPHTAFRDRYTPAGEGIIDLYSIMVPGNMPVPTSISVTWISGNGSHWTVSGGTISPSIAGDTADMSSGTYVADVTMTWSIFGAPNNTATNTITVICPTASVYVDPVTGNPNNPGTKASPWAHSPDDINASGNEVAFNPVVQTLCVHKDGSVIRSSLVCTRKFLVNASGCGWGNGTKAIYTGADTLPTSTNPTSGEVFSNPNVANIKKYSLSAPRTVAQFLLDYDASDPLVQVAQWPSAGGDPYQDSYDPFRNETGGMYRVSVDTFHFVPGQTSTWTCPPELYSKFDAEFASNSLVGYLLGHSGHANFVGWRTIIEHDIPARKLTFIAGDELSTKATAIQICGHPRSIKGPRQFAWKSDSFTTNATYYVWWEVGTKVEIMKRKVGAVAAGIATTTTVGSPSAFYGLEFQGYYGDTSDAEGCGISVGVSSLHSMYIIACDFKYLVSRNSVGAAYRGIGSGSTVDSLFLENTCTNSVGTALNRNSFIRNTRYLAYGNYGDRLNASGFYLANAVDGTKVMWNKLVGGSGPHANCLVFYGAPECEIAFNYIQGARQITIQTGQGAGCYVHDNTFICDKDFNAAGIYGAGHRFERNVWARIPNTTTNTSVVFTGGDTIVNTFDNEVFDGLIGGKIGVFKNSLVTQVAHQGTPIFNNVSPNIGNRLSPFVWNGTLPPEWRAVLGTGPHALEYIYGVIVMPQLVNLIDQEVNSPIETAWMGPITADTIAHFTLTNCQMKTNSSASDVGATTYSATPADMDLNGKYAKFKITTGSAYATDNNAIIDFGNGNIYNWTVRTKQSAGVPLMDIDPEDFWKVAANASVGTVNSKTLTFGIFFYPVSHDTGSLIGGYGSGTTGRVNIELLNTTPKRLRVTLKNAAGTTIAFFNSPSISELYNQNSLLLMTVDMDQSSVATGCKFYGNGVDLGVGNQTTWTTGETIDWAYNGSALIGFNSNNLTGKMGYAFLDHGFKDITSSESRDQFSAHRIGTNGENIMGRLPDIMLVGDVDAWMNPTGINRGAGPKLIKQTGTDITLNSAGATRWPAFDYATAASISGPSGIVDEARQYSMSVNGALANPITIALSDGGKGGTFNPTSITLSPSADTQSSTFTYRPAVSGAVTITCSSSGITSGSLTFNVVPAFTALTKGVPTTISYSQLISILQQLAATPNGLLNGSIKFSYPKNDGSRLTKIINTSYIVEAQPIVLP